MFGSFRSSNVKDLTPAEVADGVAAGSMVIVDVREPNETALERYPGAVLMPLSRFDPSGLPAVDGRVLVFACASGIRSVKASEAAQAAGLDHKLHLAGGIKAWKAAGYPTER
jgi:rhodanese-related sulfurtransferase